MTEVKAVLIKLETDDGLVSFKDHIQIGTEYTVDLDSKRVEKGFNFEKQKKWEREIINVVGGDDGWIPTELLDIKYH